MTESKTTSLRQQWRIAFHEKITRTGYSENPVRFSYTLQMNEELYCLRKNVLCINAYLILTRLDAAKRNGFLSGLLDAIQVDYPLEFIEPHWILQEDIQTALLEGHRFTDEILDGIILLGWGIQQYADKKQAKLKKHKASGAKKAHYDQNGLYVRPGIVELRALKSFVDEPEPTRLHLQHIMARIHDEPFMYCPPERPMWQRGDTSFNLRRLMTNAGFYTDEPHAWESFSTWSSAYWQALAEGTILHHNNAFWYLPGILDAIYRHKQKIPEYRLCPDLSEFYSSLAHRNLLFVTPFAEAIHQQMTSGNIRHLYRHIDIPEFSLKTLPAYISTYPNRPHAHYLETFDLMAGQVDNAVSGGGIDMFMASCGCYGLPLCHHVYRKWGITSVYIGNSANTLFGILQNASLNFQRDYRIENNWIRGDLGQYKNMDRIDKGRYL